MRSCLYVVLLFGAFAKTNAGPGDTTLVVNNVSIALTGRPTRALNDQGTNEFCLQCRYLIKRYREEDLGEFFVNHRTTIRMITRLIDSLNAFIPADHQVKKLVLWRGVGNMYKSELIGNEIHLGMGYMFLYGTLAPLQASIFHEMGHALFDALSQNEREYFESLWSRAMISRILYLFKEGTYPKAILMFGHPDDSANELFASAFTIMNLYNGYFVNKLALPSVPASTRSLVLEIETCVRQCSN